MLLLIVMTSVLRPSPARRVNPGPGRPGQTRLRPGFFFLYSYARNDVVLAFYN